MYVIYCGHTHPVTLLSPSLSLWMLSFSQQSPALILCPFVLFLKNDPPSLTRVACIGVGVGLLVEYGGILPVNGFWRKGDGESSFFFGVVAKGK